MVGKGISIVYIDSYKDIDAGKKTIKDKKTGELVVTTDYDAIRYRIVDTTFLTLIDKIKAT